MMMKIMPVLEAVSDRLSKKLTRVSLFRTMPSNSARLAPTDAASGTVKTPP